MNELEKTYVEIEFREAMSCLADAKLVAIERDYFGIAQLVDSAMKSMTFIGNMTGINGQKRIEGETR